MAKAAIPEPSKKPVASRFSADTGTVRVTDADAPIAPLLQRAITLKQRGQWEEATTVATDAVRRAPGSAAAHALLGDIYAAQNNADDALHWYRMALARSPQDAVLAQKHEHLLTQKRASITGSMPAVSLPQSGRDAATSAVAASTTRFATKQPVLTARFPLASATAERTLEWLDRIFPPGRSEGMARLLFMISGVVAFLVVVTGTVLYFGANRNDSDGEQTLAVGEIRGPSTPFVLPKTDSSAAPPKADTVTTQSDKEAAPAASPSPVISAELTRQLAVLQNGEVTVTSADTDATKTQVQLELVIPAHAQEDALATRTRVLSAASATSRAAAAALPSLERFSVRFLMRSASANPTAASSSLVFVGITSRTALKVTGDDKNPNPMLLASLFTNIWWENHLVPLASP